MRAHRRSVSVRYRIALGSIVGRKTLRLQTSDVIGTPVESATLLTANRDGFSLNPSVACRPEERERLERLWRCVARPPLALEHLGRDGDGLVVHRLKRPFRDGTTEFLFETLDFLARLAALVPRPRSHLLRYHGVLAPNARHRRLVVLAVISDPPMIATMPEHIDTRAARVPPIASSGSRTRTAPRSMAPPSLPEALSGIQSAGQPASRRHAGLRRQQLDCVGDGRVCAWLLMAA